MSKFIIKGFKLPSTDFNSIEAALSAIQTKAINRSKNLYACLLASEIENIVDDIALNVVKRPEDISIYKLACGELNNKIAWATANFAVTPYNFYVGAMVCVYKNETYIRINVPNEALLKEIRHIPDAEDFNVMSSDAENCNNANVWQEISKIYSGNNAPLARQLHPVGKIEVDWSRVEKHFHSLEERADVRVRHKLTNSLINLLSMRAPDKIPANRYLYVVDEALSMLMTDSAKYEAAQLKSNIMASIVNITSEMVFRNPNDPIENKDIHSNNKKVIFSDSE